MRVLVIEPYYSGSHKYFHEILCKALKNHNCEVLEIKMKARHWRWRMQGAHFSLAPQINQLAMEGKIDLIWTNSLVDICSLKGLLNEAIPIITFFHEHQMAYPLKQEQQGAQLILKEHIFPGIHASQYFASALSLFSSVYNRESFFLGLERFFNTRPEKIGLPKDYKASAQVCPLPMVGNFHTLAPFDKRPKRILWNHRWDYDKNPAEFIQLILNLNKKRNDFSVDLLGEYKKNVFDQLESQKEIQLSSFGGPDLREAYLERLGDCRVLPVTSKHDFFGLSVREAILSGVIPLLPKRMAYPECIPVELHGKLLYENFKELCAKCEKLMDDGLTEEDGRLLLEFHQSNDEQKFRDNLIQYFKLLNLA